MVDGPLPTLPRMRGRARQGRPRRQRQGQGNDDAYASAAAVSCFNRKLTAERLNAFLHAAKPEALRLTCRNAEAIVTHRQFQPCPAVGRRATTSPDRSRLLPTSAALLSGRTLAIARFGWGEVGPRQRSGRG